MMAFDSDNASLLQELLVVNVENPGQDPLSLNTSAPSSDAQGCEVAKPGMRYCEEVDLTLSDDESPQQAEPANKVELLHCYRCVTEAMTAQSLEFHMNIEHSFSWCTEGKVVYLDGKEICKTCHSYQLRTEIKRKMTTVIDAPATKQANVMITTSDTRHELFFIHSDQPVSNGEQATTAVDPLQLDDDDDVITLDDGPDSELKIEIHDEPLPEDPIVYQCTSCSESFSSLTVLGEHQREQHVHATVLFGWKSYVEMDRFPSNFKFLIPIVPILTSTRT
ncbi:hypothetical protein B566_EDAN005607 [Ephemera danica]|nr:hypothetical protein B566_EDAN005607 [Ephemera danica]